MTLTTRTIGNLPDTLTSLQNGDWFVVDRSGVPQKITRQNVYGDFATAFAQTLLDDADAATARATLGVNDGLQFIATADASDDATIDFTGFDATKYDGYLFVFGNVLPETDGATLQMRVSTDGGSSFVSTSAYYSTALSLVSALDTVQGVTDQSTVASLAGTVGNASTESGVSGTLLVAMPHINNRTICNFDLGFQFTDSTQRCASGMVLTGVGVHNAIRFLFSSGAIASGTITMFGLRAA